MTGSGQVKRSLQERASDTEGGQVRRWHDALTNLTMFLPSSLALQAELMEIKYCSPIADSLYGCKQQGMMSTCWPTYRGQTWPSKSFPWELRNSEDVPYGDRQTSFPLPRYSRLTQRSTFFVNFIDPGNGWGQGWQKHFHRKKHTFGG